LRGWRGHWRKTRASGSTPGQDHDGQLNETRAGALNDAPLSCPLALRNFPAATRRGLISRSDAKLLACLLSNIATLLIKFAASYSAFVKVQRNLFKLDGASLSNERKSISVSRIVLPLIGIHAFYNRDLFSPRFGKGFLLARRYSGLICHLF
jgi:hypothetical protein